MAGSEKGRKEESKKIDYLLLAAYLETALASKYMVMVSPVKACDVECSFVDLSDDLLYVNW